MIQPLRRLHFRMWLLLAILLPLMIAVALWQRVDSTPANPNLHWESLR